MSKNDKILIDGILESLEKENIGKEKGDIFQDFAVKQLLKNYDLTDDEIAFCCVDGKDDGGIDYFFTFINGILVKDSDGFEYPKTDVTLQVYIVSCKSEGTFKLIPIDSLYSSLDELFDLTKPTNKLKSSYNEKLLEARNRLVKIYKKIAISLIKEEVKIFYISSGDTEILKNEATNLVSKAEELKSNILTKFGTDSLVDFVFWGSTELLAEYRKSKDFNIQLPIEPNSLHNGSHYVVLVKLEDYYKSITNENGELKKFLFESNVRDFMGFNRVNNDIYNSLCEKGDIDFWLLNNGITMLVSNAYLIENYIDIKNVQIVNGLQTSLTIYNYFSSGKTDLTDRKILIRILKASDESTKKEIIKATNNQTTISNINLVANEKIQKNIEEILLKNQIYYEAKEKKYQNQGIKREKIITPLMLASQYLAIMKHSPDEGAKLKSRKLLYASYYEYIFSEQRNLNLWVVLAKSIHITDSFISKKRGKIEVGTKFVNVARAYLSFFAIAKVLNKYVFSENEIIQFDTSLLSDEIYNEIWDKLILIENFFIKPTKLCNLRFLQYFAGLFPEIKNIEVFKTEVKIIAKPETYYNTQLLDKVYAEIPNEDWPKNLDKKIARKFSINVESVIDIISYLLNDNKKYPNVTNEKLLSLIFEDSNLNRKG